MDTQFSTNILNIMFSVLSMSLLSFLKAKTKFCFSTCYKYFPKIIFNSLFIRHIILSKSEEIFDKARGHCVNSSMKYAIERYELIKDLLDESLDPSKRKQIRENISKNIKISERTLRRYYNRYKAYGIEGLIKKQSSKKGSSVVPENVIQESIRLRRELPTRSIQTIIRILEMEGLVEVGFLKKSTLQEQLAKHGYSKRKMLTYSQEVKPTARRFQKQHVNELWQSDIKYGPRIGEKPTYMVCFLDDKSRNIMHSEFYYDFSQAIVRDCFTKAVIKYGLPKSVYFDNGKQFKNQSISNACIALGIRLLYARPYSPESKGKMERFNQTVDSFINEVNIHNIKDIDELNRLYNAWIEECYVTQPHSSLENKTPRQCYEEDDYQVKLVSKEILKDAFLCYAKRKVDKSGCISLNGIKYQFNHGLALVTEIVDIYYDPIDLEEIKIKSERLGLEETAKKLNIESYSAKKPKVPENMTVKSPERSRLLDAVEKKYEEAKNNDYNMISFKELNDGEQNV